MSAALALALMLAPAPPSAIRFDGQLDEPFWRTARRVALPDGAWLMTGWAGRQWRLGVRLPPGSARYLDVYVADARGRLINLHASLRQGERLLTPGWDDGSPEFTWGPLPAWRASTAQRVDGRSGRLTAASLAPYQGYEIEVPARHLGTPPWWVRVEVRDFTGVGADWIWPAGSTRAQLAGWAPLRMPRR